MTPTQRKVAHIRQIIKNKGWEVDRWGHYKLTHKGVLYRLKFQKTSVRFERKINSRWFNITSDYFKNVGIVGDGKGITIGNRTI